MAVAIFAAGLACVSDDGTPSRTKGVGDRLRPFISIDSQSGKRYCQVCAFGGKPTLMAVFDLDDPAVDDDLRLIQTLVSKWPRLTAFALFGRFRDGALHAPRKLSEAQKKLADRAKRLGLSYPVTVLPGELTAGEALHYQPFTAHFDVAQSRSVLLAAADNRVRFAGRLSTPRTKKQLGDALRTLF